MTSTEDWEAGAYFWTTDDPYDDEHVAFVFHHPGFRKDIAALREDLEQGGLDPPSAIAPARHDPDASPYPVRALAGKWGLAPVDVAVFAASGGDDKLLARERSAIHVHAKPTHYELRIPRPITPVRREALQAWIKEEQRRRGDFEVRSLGHRRKPALSPALRGAALVRPLAGRRVARRHLAVADGWGRATRL